MPIGAGEGIRGQGLPTNLSQAVDPAPEVHRLDRHQNPHLRGDLDQLRPPRKAAPL